MVAEVTKPDFSYVWSSGGANVLPSNVKIQTGWTAEVPPFQWENALQNRQDNAIVHLFQKGISEWDAASNYYFTTGGTRSYVQGSDGIIYVAVQDSVGQNPTTDVPHTYWKVAFASTDNATTTTAGISRYATTAEVKTGTLTTAATTPAGVMSLLPKRTFATNDYIRIPDVPGGLIIQFGSVTTSGGGGAFVTFPTPFPNALLHLSGNGDSTIVTPAIVTVGGILSGASFYTSNGAGAAISIGVFWLAIGY